MLTIFADGCSLGNPGNSGVGVVLYRNDKKIKEVYSYIGETTNNYAEYLSLIIALTEALALGVDSLKVYMDSKLVVEQVNGNYKVKNKNLYSLNVLARHMISLFKKVTLEFTQREGNELADSLAKKGAKEGSFKNNFFIPIV